MSVTPDSVREALGSQDFGDRLRAVNDLRQLAPETAFELIQTTITDSNARVRYAGVSQLSSLGQQDLALSLQVLRDRLLNDPEPDVQAAAADSLGALKLTEAFGDLEQIYHSTNEWLVKFSIVAALGELGDRRAFDLLTEALQSGNELVQMAAIGALGELRDERAVQLLLPYAANSDWQIRYRVAQALNHLGTPATQATLETLAQDQVQQVAEEAQNSLRSP